MRRLYVGLQGAADRMVAPVTAGPVDDENPAEQLEANREEEKCSPAVSHLEKHNMTTQTRHVGLNQTNETGLRVSGALPLAIKMIKLLCLSLNYVFSLCNS